MSILSENNQITPEYLRSVGFEPSEWGSPMTRESKNTTMYDGFVVPQTDSWERYHVMYFPPDWEGVFNHHSLTANNIDVRGRLVINTSAYTTYNQIISPILEEVADMHIFIEQFLEDKFTFLSLDDQADFI